MGVLADIRTGKRDLLAVGFVSVTLWLFAGAASALVLISVVADTSDRVALIALLGGCCGLCVGLYAAFGKSRIATALSLPAALIAAVFVPLTWLEFFLMRRSRGHYASDGSMAAASLRPLQMSGLPLDEINAPQRPQQTNLINPPVVSNVFKDKKIEGLGSVKLDRTGP